MMNSRTITCSINRPPSVVYGGMVEADLQMLKSVMEEPERRL